MDGFAEIAVTSGFDPVGPLVGAAPGPEPEPASDVSARFRVDDLFSDAKHDLLRFVDEHFADCPSDEDSVDERIETLLVDETYRALLQHCSSLIRWHSIQRLVKRAPRALPHWKRLPEDVQNNLRLARCADYEAVRALVLVASHAARAADLAPPDASDDGPMAIAYLDFIPPRVRNGIVGRHVADICSFALYNMTSDPSRDVALIAELARRWLDGARNYLAILTALDLAHPIGEVLPKQFRFDRDEIDREMREAQRGLEHSMERVRATGQAHPLARA